MSWTMRLLKNLASLRLTVGLLLWLAFLCILGTIIPQQSFPSAAGAPFAMQAIMLLSLRDVFHSLWFLIPAVVLCLNALACMYLWRKISFGGSSSMPMTGLYEVTIADESRQDNISSEITSFMKGTHSTFHGQEGDRAIIMGEKGRSRKFAPFMVHGSILLILIGAGLGFLGYKGSLEVPVGQASDTVTLSNGSIMHLPFQVRCDDFKMELYENGMPKEYRSEISFFQGDSVARHTSILVNHPVSFSRVLFSQSGYNQNPIAAIQVSTPAGGNHISAAEGAVIEMHDTGYKVHVVKVVEDIMHMGPGVQLVIETPKGEKEVWIFKQIERIQAMHPGIMEKMPQFNPSLVKPYTFSLGGVTSSYTTILGINYDPGIVFVGLGSVLFMAGICIAFMVVHERVWISLEKAPLGLTMKIAQRSNGRPVAVSPRILEHLSSLTGMKS
jgi:cytochrome c biogenesis protein